MKSLKKYYEKILRNVAKKEEKRKKEEERADISYFKNHILVSLAEHEFYKQEFPYKIPRLYSRLLEDKLNELFKEYELPFEAKLGEELEQKFYPFPPGRYDVLPKFECKTEKSIYIEIYKKY